MKKLAGSFLLLTFAVMFGGCVHETPAPARTVTTTTQETAPSAIAPGSSTTTTVVEHQPAN